MMINNRGKDKSIADRILEKMHGEEDVTWIAYYGKYDDATKLIRVRKHSGQSKNRKKS